MPSEGIHTLPGTLGMKEPLFMHIAPEKKQIYPKVSNKFSKIDSLLCLKLESSYMQFSCRHSSLMQLHANLHLPAGQS